MAVYAEAQRRAEDNKELGAALAALMFNLFQLMRTIMGIVQLNAFVAWCKNAVECMRALSDKDGEDGEHNAHFGMRATERGVDSSAGHSKRRSGGEIDKSNGFSQLGLLLAWCRRGVEHISTFMSRNSENIEMSSNTDEESIGPPIHTHHSNCDDNDEIEEKMPIVPLWKRLQQSAGLGNADDGNGIENKVMLNNIVIDNELGGREVTVFPAWDKMWDGFKKRSFWPSTWLSTDRVMLNTIRWSGAFLCGMGENWSIEENGSRDGGEILDAFFSRKMYHMRDILRLVEWNIEEGNGGREILSIEGLGDGNGRVRLSGEMSTAYGTGFGFYSVQDANDVDLYSFEFDSLVSSYPAGDDDYTSGNRESVRKGLVHSVVLAKHLGVEKLKAIRRYYDRYRVPKGRIRQDAFKLLNKQTNSHISHDAPIWMVFESEGYKIPLFPYRMQAVALWDEATNWRVLQASAHQDVRTSLEGSAIERSMEVSFRDTRPLEVNIFDYCTEWTVEHISSKGLLGVVVETVRTFLAEWLVESGREAEWEPEVPTETITFELRESNVPSEGDLYDGRPRLIWVCQRELQRKVATMQCKEENLPGNAALVMLFMIGFPFLCIEECPEPEVSVRESQDEVYGANLSSSPSTHCSVDVSVQAWRVSTALAPQNISLMIRVDSSNHTVSLKLRDNNGDRRFIWQDWVDAVMGYMQGVEKGHDGDWGYGRQIVRPDLRKSMEYVYEKTGTARVWQGWPVFDLGICKFEVEEWLAASGFNLNRGLGSMEHWEVPHKVSQAAKEIRRIVWSANGDMKGLCATVRFRRGLS